VPTVAERSPRMTLIGLVKLPTSRYAAAWSHPAARGDWLDGAGWWRDLVGGAPMPRERQRVLGGEPRSRAGGVLPVRS